MQGAVIMFTVRVVLFFSGLTLQEALFCFSLVFHCRDFVTSWGFAWFAYRGGFFARLLAGRCG